MHEYMRTQQNCGDAMSNLIMMKNGLALDFQNSLDIIIILNIKLLLKSLYYC